MPTTIGGIGSTDPSAGMHGSVDSAMSALGGLGSDGFLKLLMAQLQYQDPMAPSDPSAMMNQTSALAQLDATQQLLAAQRQSLGLQQSAAAASMLGHAVTGSTETDTSVTGIVDAVSYSEDGPVLEIGGVDVPFHTVSELREAHEPVEPEETTSS